MLALTAEIVSRLLDAEQVGNPRGRVQHVAVSPHLTRTGHLRRGCRPVCGQRARRWTVLADSDPRPLCGRCRAWALRHRPDLPRHPYLLATPEQIRDALQTVTDPDELHRLVEAICSRRDLLTVRLPDPQLGRRLLTSYVPDARSRLAALPPAPRRREAPGSTYPRRVR